MSDMQDLIAIFKLEAEEHLTKLDHGLIALEKQPENLERVKELNRVIHTLKGAARVFGFKEIQDIAHRIEDVFDEILNRKIIFSSYLSEKIFKGIDGIRLLLERVVHTQEEIPDTSGLCKELEECLSDHQRPQKQKKMRKEPQRKGEEVGFQKESRPEAFAEGEDKIDQPTYRVKEGEATSPVPKEEYLRVPLSKVDKLLYLVGVVVTHKMKTSAISAETKKLSKLSKQLQKSFFSLSEVLKREGSPPYDEINKLVSQCDAQVVKLKEQTLRLYDQISTGSFQLSPVIDEMQALIKEIKMIPLATIFKGFPRMVRDIATQQGKEVEILITGEETELDKKVLDGIKTSMIHLLRNCIDHGIETPDVRIAAGKPRYGTIKISASHQADNVVIEVEDDGQGLDKDKIKETALKKQLVSDLELEGMTDQEVLNLIFLNGFSTSPSVTEVSGRGIGLDIVRRDFLNLKGQVLLETQKGKGTKFTLILPLTIAIIQVLLVKVRNMLFSLPMPYISECVKVNLTEVSTLEGHMAVQIRDQIVPLVRLEEILGLPPLGDEEEQVSKELMVLIASSLDRRVGFIVDDIVGVEEAFIKSLGRHLGKLKNVSGGIIMPNGQVVVVLDVADLIANSSVGPSVVRKKQPLKGKGKEKRILVVEDAFSIRELEKSILETHGYIVDTAVDGLDALDRVTNHRYDLIVSDIEMPRMDGFTFCETLKRNEAYKDIPIVMVTSKQKEEDKKRGIEVGAAAYIAKSAFDQMNLLDTIERLVG